MTDHVFKFVQWLRDVGMPPASGEPIFADDKKNRFTLYGDSRGTKGVSYRLAVSQNGTAYGWARLHKESRTEEYWSGFDEQTGPRRRYTAEERAAFEKAQMEKKRQDAADRRAAQDRTAEAAAHFWREGRQIQGGHQYAHDKGVDLGGVKVAPKAIDLGEGLRVAAGDLLLPLYRNFRLRNLQRIDRRGGKQFLAGGEITGCYHPIGERPQFRDLPYVFCEGWATGKTLHRILRCPVVCCMNAGNLLPVASELRRRIRYARFVFAADNDLWTWNPQKRQELHPGTDMKIIPGDDPRWETWRAAGFLENAGMTKAREAAKRTGGRVVTLPAAYGSRREKPTDFNDMWKLAGDDAVAAAFRGAI